MGMLGRIYQIPCHLDQSARILSKIDLSIHGATQLFTDRNRFLNTPPNKSIQSMGTTHSILHKRPAAYFWMFNGITISCGH